MITAAESMKADDTPLLLRRMRKKPHIVPVKPGDAAGPAASHFTVVTTQGNKPEMHDQQEDAHR